ncbi:MAG: hypothetical protein ACI825_000281 [Planctomycetota bacterium]|jgi:hypothetical protein|uniref:hypothetical protein n=1 Tax=Patiriisocius sp. Uisw_047 TaxID=3230969 RepID=UPI0039EBBCB6
MKTITISIALIMSLAVFTACTDKKKTEENLEIEVISEENSTYVDETMEQDEKRRLDSIQQVKEHGHAH